MMKIWALFSVENNYDQPPNNLVAWWAAKPDFFALAKTLKRSMEKPDDILFVVNLWNGQEVRDSWDNTDLRLVEISEGVVE